MNDPWDVKAVRRGNQYQSCMKLSGVPLLPPVLSSECRKEMQYYKLLAKEVEKRISILQPYVGDDEDSEDRTDAPELPECEQYDYKANIEQTIVVDNIIVSGTRNKNNLNTFSNNNSQLVIDFNLKISDRNGCPKSLYSSPRKIDHGQKTHELPERDCDYTNKKQKNKKQIDTLEEVDKHRNPFLDNMKFDTDYDQTTVIELHGSKNFTGSLNDIHGESCKESQEPTLTRQRSYTLLNPSPLLLAHLKEQSLNTGVDVKAISMSESSSNLSYNSKKRRSWNLELAKKKWSSMALDLRNKFVTKKVNSSSCDNVQKPHKNGTKSLTQDKPKKSSVTPPTKTPKSEPLQKNKPATNNASHKPTTKEPAKPSPPKRPVDATSYVILNKEENNSNEKAVSLVSEASNAAARVRELYEKLQRQQLMQMASLMEKQKREQHYMQQVFDEQNSLLLKQLKTVCPAASIAVKQAWGEAKDEGERGPVSLSQLINSTPDNSIPSSPAAKTLTETSNYISKCDNVLKKSRDITNSMTRKTPDTKTTNGANKPSGDVISIHSQNNSNAKKRLTSPNAKNISRKLNYDTSISSDYEPMLTDRTNDTMADLNVTFPSDNSENDISANTEIKKTRANQDTRTLLRTAENSRASDDVNIKVEDNNNTTMCVRAVKQSIVYRLPTTRELVAATKIVAYAKGYLVRRLMRTERVQGTVQTIRDALLCALQLHQEREGIRGADVDLHRRLIQQITAACYSLHDTFVASSPAERCALIAADRARKQALANKQPTPRTNRRNTDIMSQSYSGAFPSRGSRPMPTALMTQSNYETLSSEKSRQRYAANPQRRPWR